MHSVMLKQFGTIALVLTLGLAVPAFAEDRSSDDLRAVFETDLWTGHMERTGSGLNSGMGVPDEVAGLGFLGASFLAALPLGANGIAQIEFDGEVVVERKDAPLFVSDTPAGGFTLGGHLAFRSGHVLAGGFAGVGKTFITNGPFSTEHNANHYLIGAEVRALFADGALALQGGHIDSSADDPEVFSDAYFVRGIGKLFFHEGRTALIGELAYIDGDQDADSSLGPDPLEIWSWGLELEHVVHPDLNGMATLLFVAYEGHNIEETSSAGITETLTDHMVLFGVRFRAGAKDAHTREAHTAPDLPNVVRWMGGTPAVD